VYIYKLNRYLTTVGASENAGVENVECILCCCPRFSTVTFSTSIPGATSSTAEFSVPHAVFFFLPGRHHSKAAVGIWCHFQSPYTHPFHVSYSLRSTWPFFHKNWPRPWLIDPSL